MYRFSANIALASTRSSPSKTWSAVSQHHNAYKETYAEYTNKAAALNVFPHDLSPEEVAAKVTYHFWTKAQVTRIVLRREQVLPKLFKRVVFLTRLERYGIFSTSLQT